MILQYNIKFFLKIITVWNQFHTVISLNISVDSYTTYWIRKFKYSFTTNYNSLSLLNTRSSLKIHKCLRALNSQPWPVKANVTFLANKNSFVIFIIDVTEVKNHESLPKIIIYWKDLFHSILFLYSIRHMSVVNKYYF